MLDNPATQAQFARQGVEASPSTPEQLRDHAAVELARWKEVGRKANQKPE